jgi:F420-non-reducing hydrogenase iron-sulfur subunit
MVISDAGIDPERFAIEWVSSAEAPRFAEVVTQFTERIKQLGPISPAAAAAQARPA